MTGKCIIRSRCCTPLLSGEATPYTPTYILHSITLRAKPSLGPGMEKKVFLAADEKRIPPNRDAESS